MATAIKLNDLCYPDDETRLQIMSSNWPSLSSHQWAILAGHPNPFTPWEAETVTREDYEKTKAAQNG